MAARRVSEQIARLCVWSLRRLLGRDDHDIHEHLMRKQPSGEAIEIRTSPRTKLSAIVVLWAAASQPASAQGYQSPYKAAFTFPAAGLIGDLLSGPRADPK